MGGGTSQRSWSLIVSLTYLSEDATCYRENLHLQEKWIGEFDVNDCKHVLLRSLSSQKFKIRTLDYRNDFSCNVWHWKHSGNWYLQGKRAHFWHAWPFEMTQSQLQRWSAIGQLIVSVKPGLARLQLHFTQRRRTLLDPSKLPGQASSKGFSDWKISIRLLVIWYFEFRMFVCFSQGLCAAASSLNSASTRSKLLLQGWRGASWLIYAMGCGVC